MNNSRSKAPPVRELYSALASTGSRLVAAGLLLCACGDTRDETVSTGVMTEGPDSAGPSSNGNGSDDDDSSTTGPKLDTLQETTGALPGCAGDSSCDQIDIVFLIDNSGSMGEEQLNLAANFPLLVDRLQNLQDSAGNDINPDVQIMVTTTDVGHPLCSIWEKADYTPARGAPIWDGCNARINRFTGLDPTDPLVIEEACTQNCPADVVPGDPFIRFNATSSNVPQDNVAAALSCIGPQGIDGCGYEAPLEAMLQAINPDACWNKPDQEHCQNDPKWSGVQRGFLRPDATLAIAILTDETDCSVLAPGGYSYFTGNDQTYWETNPDIGIPQATPAICRKAGIECTGPDASGVYSNCTSNPDSEALHDIDRYVDYLKFVKESHGKEVVMLGILGVPEVTEHSPTAPFHPTAGGVHDLVYRQWVNDEYPMGDILPDDWAEGVTAEHKEFENGPFAWGCTGQDERGNFTGQAMPPVRIKEVCESLDFVDADGEEQIRCCIESICDTDFSAAINCLTGILQQTIPPAG